MTKKAVLLTRPLAASQELAGLLGDAGWESLIEPLLEIRPVEAIMPDLRLYQALVFTSAHGVDAFAERSRERNLPVYAVGQATAARARMAGFTQVTVAEGQAASLEARLDRDIFDRRRPLLHISGEHVARHLAVNELRIDNLVLYEAVAATVLSAGCLDALDKGRIHAAMFFSPRTAAIFTALLYNYDRTSAVNTIKALCIADSVVKSLLDLPWEDVQVADTPDSKSMIALLGTNP